MNSIDSSSLTSFCSLPASFSAAIDPRTNRGSQSAYHHLQNGCFADLLSVQSRGAAVRSHIAIVGIVLQGSTVAAVDRAVAAVGWQGYFVVVAVDWHTDSAVVVVGLHDFAAAVSDNVAAAVVPHTGLAALGSAHTGPANSGHGHTDSERTGLYIVR